MRQSKIVYHPDLSVKENAELNNCSQDNIRYYIKTHGIDRRNANREKIIQAIKDYLKGNPDAKFSDVAKATHITEMTIRKYWDAAKGTEAIKRIGKRKLPKTILGKLNLSASVFRDIFRIEDFDLDIIEPFIGEPVADEIRNQGHSPIYPEGGLFAIDPKKKSDIVSIPPYINEDVVNQCFAVYKKNMALLLPVSHLTDINIHQTLFKPHTPIKIHVYTDKPYMWVVWQRGFKGNTELNWIAQRSKTITKTLSSKTQKAVETPSEITTPVDENTDRIYGIIGAVIGDIAGSRLEHSHTFPKKSFKMFGANSFTDDTVLTVAVADAILHKKPFAKAIWDWGKLYPNAGYGGMFKEWLKGSYTVQNDSAANGGAMRISAVGFYGTSLDGVLETAKEATVPTHNSVEGLKGAQAIASATFLARKGKTKDEIKSYIETRFGYNLNMTFDDIKQMVLHKEGSSALAIKSVPVAIIAFLQGNDYEDVIRTAISYGGDTDTIGCMAGSIAAAFYGVPKQLAEQAARYLSPDLLSVINEFDGTSLTNRIAPKSINTWRNDIVVVYGCNSDNSVREEGFVDTIHTRYNYYPKKGYPIHAIGTSIETIKSEIDALVKRIKADPSTIYIIKEVGISKMAGYSIETIAPLFKPLMRMENVLMLREYWDYLQRQS